MSPVHSLVKDRRAQIEELKRQQQQKQQTIKPSPHAIFYNWLEGNKTTKENKSDLDTLGVY